MFAENAGFTGNTLITLVRNEADPEIKFRRRMGDPRYVIHVFQEQLQDVKLDDSAQCWLLQWMGASSRQRPWFNLINQKISHISQHEATHYYAIIITADEYFVCGDDQRFYDATTDSYLTAKKIHEIVQRGGKVTLSSEVNLSKDYVVNVNGQGVENGFIKITTNVLATFEFNAPNNPVTLYDISVDFCHNYKVGKYSLIAHNMEVVAQWAVGNGQAILEGVGVALGGLAARWQRQREPEYNPTHYLNHCFNPLTDDQSSSQPPNKSNKNGGPGDPNKPNNSKGPNKNGPSKEDIAQLLAYSNDKNKKSVEDEPLCSTPERLRPKKEQKEPEFPIHEGQQGKHLEGHNNYDPKGTKSILTHKDPQGLVDKYAGTGIRSNKAQGNFADAGYQEIIDFEEIIGYHVDEDTRVHTPTQRGKIHYSKNGVHIVPIKPE